MKSSSAYIPSLTGSPWTDQLVAGAAAGALSTFVCHPLDIIKIQCQVYQGGLSSNILTSRILPVYRVYGWRGWYTGLFANMAASVVSWGSYFYFYALLKDQLSLHSPNKDGQLRPFDYFISSFSAGFITILISNPLWLIKTRMCLQPTLISGTTKTQISSDSASRPLSFSGNSFAYKGMFHAFKTIWKTEGILGLYKGLIPGIVGISHGGVQFVVYEELKKWRKSFTEKQSDSSSSSSSSSSSLELSASDSSNTQLSTTEYLAMSSTSKILATMLTYPYQVVRSRLQANTNTLLNRSIRTIVMDMIKKEGWISFYKGMAPNILRVLPSTCITFITYEKVSHYCKTHGRI